MMPLALLRCYLAVLWLLVLQHRNGDSGYSVIQTNQLGYVDGCCGNAKSSDHSVTDINARKSKSY